MGDNPLDQQHHRWHPAVVKLTASVLFGLSAIRVVKPEGPALAVLVAAVAPLLVFASAALATYALRNRRWVLFGTVFALVVLQGYWLLADMGAGDGDNNETASTEELVTVATVNVNSENLQVGQLLKDLMHSSAGVPDVIAIQEVTPEVAAQIEVSAAWDSYPHRYLDPLPGFYGSAILSRIELLDPRVEWVDGWPMSRAEIATPSGQTVSILNVHVVAPLSSEGSARWKRQINQLGAIALTADKKKDVLILAGDFNATVQHPTMARLTDSGAVLADAHLEAGSGLGFTWPDLPLGVSLVRLDRVLISQRVTAIAVETVEARGSDHRAVVAKLAINQN